MDWFTVQGSLRDHEKWMALSPVGRGAWITLMTIGHSQPGSKRWTLGKRSHVEAQLRREGFSDPGPALDELLRERLVDDKRGVLSMHDASEHQRFLSDTPDRIKDRVTRHRARKSALAKEHDETAGNGGKRQGTAGNGDRQTDKETDKGIASPSTTNSTAHLPKDKGQAVTQLVGYILARWHWPKVSDGQKAILQDAVDYDNYSTVAGWLKELDPDKDDDPIKEVKDKSHALRKWRQDRADARAAEHNRLKAQERGGAAATLGDILDKVQGGTQ